jgi:very-short-patch-repair endonuclease
MSYTNQPDHGLLDRRTILPILRKLTEAQVASAPVASTRSDHLERLSRLAGSELEREWLRFLETRDHRLPTGAQELIAQAATRPDFVYDDQHTVIYIDGPVHEYPERQQRDVALTERLEDLGLTVIRFGRRDEWAATIDRYPNIFGAGRGV